MRSKFKSVLVVFITLSLSWWFGRPIFEIIKKEHRLEILKEEVARMEKKKRDLAGIVEYYKTDKFIEKEARDKLNMVKPGEKVVIIMDEQLQGGEVAGEQKTLEKKVPNWEKWVRLFLE